MSRGQSSPSPPPASLRLLGRRARLAILLLQLFVAHETAAAGGIQQPYYGVRAGKFTQYFHDVAGEVFIVDDKTLFIKGFSYDGQGPDAYFWAGSTPKPDDSGFIIPDENGSLIRLGAYRNKDLVLRLPPNRSLRSIKWISVWCKKFSANFADLYLPQNIQVPKPVTVEKLPTWDHGVTSGPVTIMDSQTFLVPAVMYDGLGPAAYWWVSKGERNHRGGLRLLDENGNAAPLPRYTGKTVVINLPDGHSVYDYDRFGIYCELADVDFGSVKIPHAARVPPSLRALSSNVEPTVKATPQVVQQVPALYTPHLPTHHGIQHHGGQTPQVIVLDEHDDSSASDDDDDDPQNKLNCEILHDPMGLELRWIMDGDEIIMQLVGRVDVGEYMAFGLSKDDTKSKMVGTDAVVTWIDHRGRGHAVDYYLGSKEQCVGNRGACPDLKHRGARNSITILNTAIINGYHMITFKRPQVALDEKFDQHVYSDGPQAVVWALGPINGKGEVSYHKLRTKGDLFIDFARPPQWNCPKPDDISTVDVETPFSDVVAIPKSEASEPAAWTIPPVVCPADNKFYAQIGPAGGKRGYQSITGHVGWGIAWYINGLMIPELYVQRGVTYTFVVEGGNNKTHASKNHPFYITSDPVGGYEHKSPADRRKEKTFAGVVIDRNGHASPTAKGRLCNYEYPFTRPELPDDYETFESFAANLEIKCQQGRPAYLQWTPDQFTPDLVYYQCYTHRHLGWKIHVVDNCADIVQHRAAASQRNEVSVPSPQRLYQNPHAKRSVPSQPKFVQNEIRPLQYDARRRDYRRFEFRDGQHVIALDNSTDFIVVSNDAPSAAIYQHQHYQRPPSPSLGTQQPLRSEALSQPTPVESPTAEKRHSGSAAVHSEKQRLVHRPRINSIRMESGFRPVTSPPRGGLPDPTTPRPGQMGPLPLLRKDPLPFQGSFKPGVPHFGGFNVSYEAGRAAAAAAASRDAHATPAGSGLPQVPRGALTRVDGFLPESRVGRAARSLRAHNL